MYYYTTFIRNLLLLLLWNFSCCNSFCIPYSVSIVSTYWVLCLMQCRKKKYPLLKSTHNFKANIQILLQFVARNVGGFWLYFYSWLHDNLRMWNTIPSSLHGTSSKIILRPLMMYRENLIFQVIPQKLKL